MKKRVLIILGNPSKKNSLCRKISEVYKKNAKKSGASIDFLDISKLKFDPILHEGYKKKQSLEKDLKKSQELIKKADHIVIIFPIWWGNFPALLKGFIDRIFLPGFGFKYKENSSIQEKFLKGKTARIIMTTGGPRFLYLFKNPAKSSLKYFVFYFCGISPTRTTLFGSVENISRKKLNKILKKVEKLGKEII